MTYGGWLKLIIFLVLVELPPWPGPTRLESAEEKSTCVETEEHIAAEGED